MRRIRLRQLLLLVSVLVLASSVFAVSPVAAQAAPVRDGGSEAGFVASLNQQRAAGGLAPLAVNQSMTNAAASWAHAMAAGSFLAHASDIVTGTPGGWSKVGENVGRGQSVTSLTSAFMNSPGHRANIMDPTYTHVGIAVFIHPTDGRIYTTHRFAALGAPAPVVPPTPVPPPVAPTPIPPPPPAPTATPIPAPVIPPTPIPTAVPTLAPEPTPIPNQAPPVEPTAVPATPVPVEQTATAIPATPTPRPEPTATAIPATPTPRPEPTATAIPATPTPEPEPEFGEPPEQLAFVDTQALDAANRAKLASKTAKLTGARGDRS